MARRNLIRRLTERDGEVLRWIGQGGVANLGQIARRFWSSRKVDTALDRLRQLAKTGYLAMHLCDPCTIGMPNSRWLFTLTEQGSLLFSPSERQSFYIGLPTLAEIRQQLLAQEAYLRLEAQMREQGGELVQWKSERALRAETLTAQRQAKRHKGPLVQAEIPDAQATVVTSSGELRILHIEVDGAYYGKMLWQKADSLAKAGYPVIWVCTEGRTGYIQERVGKYPNIQVLSL